MVRLQLTLNIITQYEAHLEVTEDDEPGILIVSLLLLVLGIYTVPRDLRRSETKIYEGPLRALHTSPAAPGGSQPDSPPPNESHVRGVSKISRPSSPLLPPPLLRLHSH